MNMNFLKKAAVMLAFVSASFGAQKASAQETPVKKKAQTEVTSGAKKAVQQTTPAAKKATVDYASEAKKQDDKKAKEKIIQQKLKSGEIKAVKVGTSPLKNDKGEVIGTIVEEDYVDSKTGKKVGEHTYSRTFEVTTTKTPYEKVPARTIAGTPIKAATPAPVVRAPLKIAPINHLTADQLKKANDVYKNLTPMQRLAQDKAWTALVKKNKEKQIAAYKAAHPDTPPAAPVVQSTAPIFIPAVIDTATTTNSKEVLTDMKAVLFEDSVATPVAVEEKRPMKLRINYGQTGVISPDGTDLMSGKSFKFMEFGITTPVFGKKGTVGEWFSVDADFKIGYGPKAENTIRSPGCGCLGGVQINADQSKLAYRGELSLLTGKDFNVGKKDQFTFGTHLAVGGVIRSIPVITDKGLPQMKQITPEVIKAPQNFGGFAEARLRGQWNITKNMAVFAEYNIGAQTFKTNTESVFLPNAKQNNELASEYPYGNAALDKSKWFQTGKAGLVFTLGR